jgi:hypothetical protein
MAIDRQRSWASGVAGAPPIAPRPSLPATGTPPGGWTGRGAEEHLGGTDRTDAWWALPLVQGLGLVLFFGYATWAALQGTHYELTEGGRNYLSPFYSPLLRPGWWPFSPALLILGGPVGFRATCYYYRKAYYRALFADPYACAVGELRSKGYCGELKFPFVLQNAHRFFMYIAMLFMIPLWWDVIKGFTFAGAGGQATFGIGGGSLAILASTGLLTFYTFSCHSVRHMIGGKLDCFSCAVAGGPRHKAWAGVSRLNEHHMGYAWWSLMAVCFADLYIRLCAMGVWHDPRLL